LILNITLMTEIPEWRMFLVHRPYFISGSRIGFVFLWLTINIGFLHFNIIGEDLWNVITIRFGITF
jgi:hypothetical protein